MTRTATTAASKTITINKVKAKHFANQAGLDRLQELLVKATSNPNVGQNYATTIKRAFRSLQECKEPILTQKDAVKLKYIGPAMAKRICPQSTGVEVSTASSKAKKPKATSKNNVSTKMGIDEYKNDGNTVSGAGVEAAGVLRGTPSRLPLVCPRPSLPSTSRCTSSSEFSSTPSLISPTAKEQAYAAAKAEAERLVLPPRGPWKVILLVDIREHKSKQVVSSCKQAGIPCEERQLAIGDMAWIARCVVANGNESLLLAASSGTSKKRKKNSDKDKFRTIEILLGTIVERKEVSDLASSLFGTRYAEQRLRLSQSGLPQVLFLVEGNLASVSNCPAETLQMAMMETRINLGFQIVQTKHLTDTVIILKTLHARIVQRTFPDAFGKPSTNGAQQSQALPTFGGGNKRRGGRGNRRASSLLELVFDTAPVPPFGSKRFITYPELKAKVEVDRERGTRSVRAISLAMMKQIPTLSQKKCTAIARHYPTMNRLLSALAYPDPGNQGVSARKQHPKKAVEEIEIDSGRRKIGPKSASEIYDACCTLQDGSTVACHKQDTKEAAAESSQGRTSSFLSKAHSPEGENNENRKPPAAAKRQNTPLSKKARTQVDTSSRAVISNTAHKEFQPFESLGQSSPERPSRAFTTQKCRAPTAAANRTGFKSPEAPQGRIQNQILKDARKPPRYDIDSPSRSKEHRAQQETVDLLTPESSKKPKAKPAFSKDIVAMELSDFSDSSNDICDISRNARNKTAIASNCPAKTSFTTNSRPKPKFATTKSFTSSKIPATKRRGLATSVREDTLLSSSDEEDSPLSFKIASKDVAKHTASVLAASDGEDTLLLSPFKDDSPLSTTKVTKTSVAKVATANITKCALTKRKSQTNPGSDDSLLLSSDEESSPFSTNITRNGALVNGNFKKAESMNRLKPNSQATPENTTGKRLSLGTSPDEGSFLFSSPDETAFTPSLKEGNNRNKTQTSVEKNPSFEAKPHGRSGKSSEDSKIVCLLDDSDDESTHGAGESVACNGFKKTSNNFSNLSANGRSTAFVTTTRGGALPSTQESAGVDDSKNNSSDDDLEFGTSLRERLGAIRGRDLKEVIELDSDSD